MISRFRPAFALGAVLTSLVLLTVACEKVPLLAPTGSTINLTALSTALPINGTTSIIAQVIEAAGTPPHSGTRITFTTNLGRLEPSEADTDVSGRVVVTYVASGGSGTATITAISGGVSVAAANVVKIAIGSAAVGAVSVTASPSTLSSAGGTSTITATVADISGNALSSVPVTFAIDTASAGSAGSLSATVVITDAFGHAQTSLTTSRTTTVSATAGITTTTAPSPTTPTTPTTPATTTQVGRVTVIVNTTSTIAVGTQTPTSPQVGQTVTLPLTYGAAATGSTASPITRVIVDWGDSQTQSFTGQPAAISHTYRSPGSYLVLVTGVDSFGDVATTTTSVTVVARPGLAVTVSASSNPQPNVTTTFTIGATPSTGCSITSITIDFGDTTPRVTLNGNATSVQHIYTSAGTFTVTVIATDSCGLVGSGATVIVVGSSATTASFTISPSTGTSATIFNFNGTDSSSPSGITNYFWEFGDSVTLNGLNPTTSHKYSAAGTYTVRLTVTDGAGRTATSTKTITVT